MNIQTTRYSNTEGVGVNKPIEKHVQYIFRDYGKNPEVDGLTLYQNIRPKDQNVEGVIKSFHANEKYRHKKNTQNKQRGYAQNTLHSYDEIISIASEDHAFIMKHLWVVQDFGKELMACFPDAIGVGVIHVDKKHIHLHYYRHAFKFKALSNTRTNNKLFTKVRQHLEKIQKERYPQLKTKIIYQDLEQGMKAKKKGRSKAKKNEIRYQERTNKILDKDLMKSAVMDLFHVATNPQQFYQLLSEHNIEIYSRGNDPTHGVYYGKRKLRFSTIGITPKMLKDLSKKEIEISQKQANKEVEKNQKILQKYSRFNVRRFEDKNKDKDRGMDLDI